MLDQCPECGSKRVRIVLAHSGRGSSFFAFALQRLLASLSWPKGGQYRWHCKDCGKSGVILVN